jgi:prepilin-type N-terminal cleavage/methylation domain-containing protein
MHLIFNKTNKGFTLVEMAVVLVIGATLLTAGLKVLSAQLENANYTKTKNKLDVIKDALTTYLAANNHLPCPYSDFTKIPGVENRVGAITTACTSTYGVVPYQTLQLAQEAALDGWENYISYQISTAPANADWSLTSNFKVGSVGSIKVSTRDSSSSAAVVDANLAAVVLVSHGKNGGGAYTVKGTKYSDSPGTDEVANASLVTAANTFYRRGFSDDSAGGGAFDDMVLSILPNDLITPLAKQGVLKLPKAQLADQFTTIQNAIIGSIVADSSCNTPTEQASHGFPPSLGLSASDMTDPWGTPIEYHQDSSSIRMSTPNITGAVVNTAFTLTSTGSGASISFSKTVSAAKGIVAQSINSYNSVCP